MPNQNDISRLLEYRNQKKTGAAPKLEAANPEAPVEARPESIDWGGVDPRFDEALSKFGYMRPGTKTSGAEPESAPEPNFAGRPGAYIKYAMDTDIAGLPKLREKNKAAGWALENIADPVLGALNALWEAYGRPTYGMTQALSEKSPKFKQIMGEHVTGEGAGPMSFGQLYTPERQAERNEWFNPEKGSFTRTAFDVATGLPRFVSNLATLPAAYRVMNQEGIKPSEMWKEGYNAWERLPENVKSWSYLADPLDLVGGVVGKVGKASGVIGEGGKLGKAISKIPGAEQVGRTLEPVFAPARRELRKFTEPIVEQGGALKTAEELGMKPGRELTWNPKTWGNLFRLTPESEAVEKMVNAVDYAFDPIDQARKASRSAEAMGAALDDAFDAATAMGKPDTAAGSVARSKRGQEVLRASEGFSGAGKQLAMEYESVQPVWKEAYKAAEEAGQDVNEWLRAAKADKAHPFHENAKLLSKVPRNLEELQYRMLARAAEYTGANAAKLYGVNAPGAWNMFNNVAKTAQSYLFLATSPMYAAMNVLNNLATALFHDVGALTDIGKVRDRIGLPARARAGIGMAGVETGGFGGKEKLIGDAFEEGREAIRKAVKASSEEPSGATKFWGNVHQKLGGPLQSESPIAKGLTSPMRVAQWAEQRQGEMATAVGTLRSWRDLWREGKAIPQITDETLLAGLQEFGLLDDFNAVVRSSMNPTELTDALYKSKGMSARRAMETLDLAEEQKGILAENLSKWLDRIDEADDPVAEVQRIFQEETARRATLQDNITKQKLDFDKRNLEYGKLGAVVGMMSDIDDMLFDAYRNVDRFKSNFFDYGGSWEATSKLIDDTFQYAFDLSGKRIEQARGWLKANGFNGEDWFVGGTEWKRRRDEVVKVIRDLEPNQIELRRQAWTNYFDWYDAEKVAANRRMLEGIAESSSPEVVDIIERISQAEAESTSAYRRVLEDLWGKLDSELPPELSRQDIRQIKNRWFAEATEARDAAYDYARDVRSNLYAEYAAKVNEGKYLPAAPVEEGSNVFQMMYQWGAEDVGAKIGIPDREAIEDILGSKISDDMWDEATRAWEAGYNETERALGKGMREANQVATREYLKNETFKDIWNKMYRGADNDWAKTVKIGGKKYDPTKVDWAQEFAGEDWWEYYKELHPELEASPYDLLVKALEDYDEVRKTGNVGVGRAGKAYEAPPMPGVAGRPVQELSEETQRIARAAQYGTANIDRPRMFSDPVDGLNDISHPDMSLNLIEMDSHKIDAAYSALPQIAEQMMIAPVGDYSKLPQEVVDKLIEHVRDTVVPAMNDTRLGARKLGEWMRDQAMLNYNRRYGYNQALGMIFPYEFWFTTSLGHWAKKFAQQPELLAVYARMKESLANLEDDLPSRLSGMVRFKVPFLPDWMGDYFVDPLSIGLPFQNFLYPIEAAAWDSEKESLQKNLEYAIEHGASEDEINEIRSNIASIPDSGIYDIMGTIMSPGLQWKLADLLRSDKDLGDLEMLMPGSRFLKGATSLAGVNQGQGIDVESMARQKINSMFGTNLPTQGEWDDYLIQRMLSNMAEQGDITNDEAQRAMIEKTGDAWEKAKALATQETGLKAITPWRDAIFPTGEENIRGVFGDYANLKSQMPEEGTPEYDAWKERRSQWFDENPVYGTKQLTYGLPGAQYREYLSNRVWDEINKSDVKSNVAWKMFRDEMTALVEKRATTEQIARLANAMGIEFPKMSVPEGVPEPEGFKAGVPEFESNVTDEQVERFGDYLAEIEKKFGKDIYQVQNGYYESDDKQYQRSYLQQHPELKDYWEFARNWKEANQDITRIAWPTRATEASSTSSARQDLLQRVARSLARRGNRR